MAAQLAGILKRQFTDENGVPLVGGKIYSYQAGTTTPVATYTDATGATPNTNPIILDLRGEANIWVSTGSYKFVLTDSSDVVQWTQDNVQGAAFPFLSKGDLLISNASGVPTRLPIGTNGQVLAADSTSSVGASWTTLGGTFEAKTSAFTAEFNKSYLIDLSTTATAVVTLPSAIGNAGKEIEFYRVDNTITRNAAITGSLGQLIAGKSNFKLVTQYDYLKIKSDGAGYIIVSKNHNSNTVSVGAMTITATTTSPTKGPMVRDNVSYQRFGDSAKFRYEFKQSAGGATGSGDYLFALPTGLSFDSSKVTFYTGDVGSSVKNTPISIGSGALTNTTEQALVTIIPYDATKFRVNTIYTNGSGTNRGAVSSGTWPMGSSALSFSFDFIAQIENFEG